MGSVASPAKAEDLGPAGADQDAAGAVPPEEASEQRRESNELSDDEVASAMRRGASSPLSVLPQLALYDLHALGYVLLELIVNALRPDPTAPGAVEMQGLKRLVEEKESRLKLSMRMMGARACNSSISRMHAYVCVCS